MIQFSIDTFLLLVKSFIPSNFQRIICSFKSSLDTFSPMRGKSVDFVVMTKEFFKGELLFLSLFFNTCKMTIIFQNVN